MTAYTCSECGETIDGFGNFGNHRKAHRAAGRAAGTEARPPKIKSTRRRIEDVQTASDDPGTDPQADPPPGPLGGSNRPSVDQPSIRVSPEQTAASVSEVVRDSLPVATLADIIGAFSVAVSELDGAGEAGHLSKIQSAQIAALLHEPTVEFVVSRLAGDVNKFKAGLAILLIVIGKGGVHARAIRAKAAGRRAVPPPVQPAPEDHPYVAGQPAAPGSDYTAGAAVPTAPPPTADGRAADVGIVAQNGALAAAMKRQRVVPANLP